MKKNASGDALADMMERTTLCVSGPEPGIAAHDGDKGFRETVQQHYSVVENNVVEQLVRLKQSLREATTYDFWSLLMEGMTSITGAQYGFVTKRILVDDQNSAVEMPPIGEPGSCLLGVAFYYNDGEQLKNLHRDYKYLAYGAPCHNMKHDKVFLIPEGLQRFVLNNPNAFPFPTEAYLGVPLFAEGKCFGHFGMMWTVKGVEKLRLGWGYVELLLHALEDVILERLVDGQSYAKDIDGNKLGKVIPTEAVTAAQSLKPYARSLSHELRTPMQGVVGMLDVMHATVQESLEGQSDASVRRVFKTLRENIEVVQDSSRRAVEAADNVVHAYDLNMQVPDTPNPPNDDESVDAMSTTSYNGGRPSINIEGKSIFFRRSKRQRTSDSGNSGPVTKHRHLQSRSSTPRREISPHTTSIRTAVEESDSTTGGMEDFTGPTPALIEPEIAFDLSEPEYTVTPSLRHTKVRDLLHLTINDSLRNGGRPESAIAEDIDGGEIIEVKTRSSNGDSRTKIIEWSVDPQVPETILVDERDLLKLVSCIFMNAVKFTEEGRILLRATLTTKAKFIVINVVDTGPGIPQAFQPYLFKAFSREDDSLTRQKEGLGLGLMVAKGLARRIGGDLRCVRTDTDGPRRGSEFELRIPISYTDPNSRATSLARTPTPARLPASESTPKSRARRTSSIDHRRTPRSHHTPTASKTPDPFQFTKASSPLGHSSFSRRNSFSQQAQVTPSRRPSTKKAPTFDRHLAKKHPLTFLVAEDNKINRKLLVNMLGKLGYTGVHEAYDGAEAVRQMSIDRVARGEKPIDVILMDLWMPNMDGYEATQRIFATEKEQERRGRNGFEDDDDDGRTRRRQAKGVTVLAVSADVTDTALEKAREVGMEGFMTKPYKLLDLERLVLEYCSGEK
ncbi:MAG: hypothetical protein ALECFALPRED_009842 [Alectoria fallacina]|uniref:histidine kinase n=1 Tax=Alectoria fallacina TaxID=1903189 RepID=A0A8H3J8L3_9LECA|nr:MAG: hypothetical protein ALECFALPRED_009842 [Alectoria fallacina]